LEIREEAEFRKRWVASHTDMYWPSSYTKRVSPDEQITISVDGIEGRRERDKHQAKLYRNLRTPCSCMHCAVPRNSIFHKPSEFYSTSDVRRMKAADFELSSFGGRDED